jgi:hypothetical protein
MRILFLDDEKGRVTEFEQRTGLKVTHVLTRGEFCDALQNQRFDLIMLDHDLGWEQDNQGWNGAKAAAMLAGNRLHLGDDTQVIIHSANPIGVANMLSHMRYADHLRVSVVHFAWAKCKYCEIEGLTFTFK